MPDAVSQLFIETFFNDLEDLLQKYLEDDWMWVYPRGKPLSITSETLSKAWEEHDSELELIEENNNA